MAKNLRIKNKVVTFAQKLVDYYGKNKTTTTGK